jgi:hypothetical protein
MSATQISPETRATGQWRGTTAERTVKDRRGVGAASCPIRRMGRSDCSSGADSMHPKVAVAQHLILYVMAASPSAPAAPTSLRHATLTEVKREGWYEELGLASTDALSPVSANHAFLVYPHASGGTDPADR